MPYSADAIANRFLDLASSEGRTLSPMQIQKLVFHAHGWYLALDEQGRRLISELVEAWRHGPVIRSLCQEFAEFGSEPIPRKAREIKWTPEFAFEVSAASIEEENPPDADQELACAVIDRIWKLCSHLTAYQLSNMTHAEDQPWRIVRNAIQGPLPRGLHIPNEVIRNCCQ